MQAVARAALAGPPGATERPLSARCGHCVDVGSGRAAEASERARAGMSLDDEMIETPDGPMTWAQWKKKNPVQIPSRRTKGKDLPVRVKRFTDEK